MTRETMSDIQKTAADGATNMANMAKNMGNNLMTGLSDATRNMASDTQTSNTPTQVTIQFLSGLSVFLKYKSLTKASNFFMKPKFWLWSKRMWVITDRAEILHMY
jgi:hypothetical protein